MKNIYDALYRQARTGELNWRNLGERFPFGTYANKVGRRALISHDFSQLEPDHKQTYRNEFWKK